MHEQAIGAVTAEDLAFERALQATVAAEPALDIEPMPRGLEVKAENTEFTHLKDVMDEEYTPAATHTDLLEQVHLAKELGADSIEADPRIVRQLTLKSGYPEVTGYLWFQDVRVWIAGRFATAGSGDRMSIEQKVFGNSKFKIQPIMDLGEKPK